MKGEVGEEGGGSGGDVGELRKEKVVGKGAAREEKAEIINQFNGSSHKKERGKDDKSRQNQEVEGRRIRTRK